MAQGDATTARPVKRRGRDVRYTSVVAKRDPHESSASDRGATPTEIKAAWRRLARAHHPDLTGDDPAASRVATRQMAEINDAYAALTRVDGTGRGRRPALGAAGDRSPTSRPAARRPAAPQADAPGHRPGRHERHVPAAQRGPPRTGVVAGTSLPGQPPLRGEIVDREPPRASTPTGSAGPRPRSATSAGRRRRRSSGRSQHVVEFGKFHGHTLGQIAAFEPSYVDWLAGTVTRDPDLVAAARVVQADLDRRGILRRRPPGAGAAGAGRSA